MLVKNSVFDRYVTEEISEEVVLRDESQQTVKKSVHHYSHVIVSGFKRLNHNFSKWVIDHLSRTKVLARVTQYFAFLGILVAKKCTFRHAFEPRNFTVDQVHYQLFIRFHKLQEKFAVRIISKAHFFDFFKLLWKLLSAWFGTALKELCIAIRES
jgi:hypothetical protein